MDREGVDPPVCRSGRQRTRNLGGAGMPYLIGHLAGIMTCVALNNSECTVHAKLQHAAPSTAILDIYGI